VRIEALGDGVVVPRVVAEVERIAELGVERAEQEDEEAVVARLRHLDPDRTELRAEGSDAHLEGVEPLDPAAARDAAAHRDSEAEAIGHVGGPALELFLGRKVVERRVQLDGRQPLAVAAQELVRLRVGGVETAAPRGVGEA
jgi:hypothetical protein